MWLHREGTIDLGNEVALVIMSMYQKRSITISAQVLGGKRANIAWNKDTVIIMFGRANPHISNSGELVAVPIMHAQDNIVPLCGR